MRFEEPRTKCLGFILWLSAVVAGGHFIYYDY